MKETELYEPVVSLLENYGFSLKGEIGEVDIFGMKENLSIAVELKTKISLKLIYQAVERQKYVDITYIAIPKVAIKSHEVNARHFYYLLRRLEIGLILVSNNTAQIEFEAIPFDRRKSISKNKTKKAKLVKEFNTRSNTSNVGGMRGKKITLYKEKAVLIASHIISNGISSPKTIKENTNISETSSILQKNYYNWFERIERGKYQVNSNYLGEIIALHNLISK